MSNLVPGIDVANASLLQGRMLSYVDTQLTRLAGPNLREIPINRAFCPVHNMQPDGLHRHTIAKGRVNYEPSSIDAPAIKEVPIQQGGFASYPAPLTGTKLRKRSKSFADHYSQATLFWRIQTPHEQQPRWQPALRACRSAKLCGSAGRSAPKQHPHPPSCRAEQ